MTEYSKIRNVAVYLGSADDVRPAFRQAVVDFAEFLAANDMTLIFGGSCCGMMKLLGDTMLRRGGRAVGVFTRCLPERLFRADLTETVITETLAERKAEMLRRADAAVALPGGLGTFDELFDALAQKKLGAVNCPVGVLNVEGFFDPLLDLLARSHAAGFTSAHAMSLLCSASTPAELLLLFAQEKK